MQYKQTPAVNRIKLQAGMYCHLHDNKLIINDVTTLEPSDLIEKLDKSSSTNKFHYVLNIILTLLIFAIAIIFGFYFILLAVFISLWHLRKIKQKKLPENKSNCIPIKYIEKIQFAKGTIGFNYLKVVIKYQDNLSVKTLKLYDSESTLAHAIGLLKDIIPTESDIETHSSISGPKIDLGQKDAYIISDEKLFFTNNLVFEPNRKDDYLYIRWISYIFMGLGVIAILIKINIILVSNSNYIDWLVVLMFILLLFIPYKYVQKSRPNIINFNEILEVIEEKKKLVIRYKSKDWITKLKVIIPKEELENEDITYLKTALPNFK